MFVKNPATQKESLLHRPRLDDLLSKAVKNSLVKVTAGSGYGKTQTTSMFLSRSNYKIAWMDFSKVDNFPERFWSGFLNSLLAQEDDDSHPLKQLGFPVTLMEFDRFLRIFTDYIPGNGRFILVFDDFHFINDSTVIDFVEKLIAANIRNLCTIILSRTKIAIKANFQSQITEMDLRFTLAETDEYLKKQTLSLTEAETKHIRAYTNGWPLAIYLSGLNLKKNHESAHDPLAITKPIIFQLIEDEIFSHYTQKEQEFIVKLSLLEEFDAGLIQCFSDINNDAVGSILESNMFINYNPYTEKYHLHNVFLLFLRKKQYYLEQQEIDDIYLTAAKWYHRSNYIIDAMNYYEKCGHREELWPTILNTPPTRRPRDTTLRFIQFLEGFSEEFVKENPMVRVIRASYMLNNLELETAAENMLDLIEEYSALPDTAENKAIMGEAYIVLALIRQTQKDYSFADYYKKADAYLPNGSIRDYRYTKLIDSNNSINPNSLERMEVIRQQRALFEAIPHASRVMNGFGYGIAYLSSAELAYFRGDLKKAQSDAFESIYRAKEKEQSDIMCNALFLLMKISLAKGNYSLTLGYIQQLREYALHISGISNILEVAEGWFYIRMGREEKVARWLLNDPLNLKTHPPISVGRDRLIMAYYLLKNGRCDELLSFSTQADKLFEEKGLWLDLVSIRIFIIISLYYIGDIPQCIAAFQALYDIVSSNHFIMQFVEMGNDICNVINNIKKSDGHNIPEMWLDNIYSKASTYSKRQAFYISKYNAENTSAAPPHIHLTSREKEVLDNLSQGLTREEIASSLDISPNTVKSTLRNIYNKLGAINSTDAIRIAINMNLINH